MVKKQKRNLLFFPTFVTFVAFVAFSLRLQAQGVIGVGAVPKTPQVALAQPAEILYTVRLPAKTKLDLAAWKAGVTQWKDFVLWDFRAKTRSEDDREITDLTIFLVPFNLGDLEIPAIEIPTKAPDGPGPVVKTPPVAIKVVEPEPDSNISPGLQDIKAPKKPLYFWENPWFWGPLAAVLLVAALGGFFAYRKLKKNKHEAARRAEENLTPEEAFYRNLKELTESDSLAKGAIREFYFGLSEIFRSYLARRFLLDIESLTTNELMRALHQERQTLGIGLSHLMKLKEQLEISDLAKFAKYRPNDQENEGVVESLKEFVEAHRPAPPAKDQAAGAAQSQS
ncbi:MAG: hypothetical protein HY401_02010 [Elusimicrobia bacterium]|nr:hypothetical protein [Elusimicrobiota bacterium]